MPSASAKVEFVQFHRPALLDGVYSIEVAQTIRTAKSTKIAGATPISKIAHTFVVRGPEFSLPPQDIYAVFPPEGSLGEHSNVLPHVSLRRSTLPWERLGNPVDQGSPWLALLVLHEEELKSVSSSVVSLDTLMKASTGPVRWPGAKLQPGTDLSAKVSVLDVPVSLLRRIAPSTSDIGYLAHVRQEILFTADFGALSESTRGRDIAGAFDRNGIVLDAEASVSVEEAGERWRIDDKANGRAFIVRKDQGTFHVTDAARDELAVIVANRLPLAGGMSVAHLVSIAGRYGSQGFNYDGAGDDVLVRLVSLKSWRFSCVDDKQDFKALLMHLNHQLLFRLDGWGASDKQDWLNEAAQVASQLARGAIPDVFVRNLAEKDIKPSGQATIESCQWRIVDSLTTYFIGNDGTVFDAAGKPQFKLPSVLAAKGMTSELRDAFRENRHPLLDKKRKPATIAPLADRWWISDGPSLYYVTAAKDFIDVFAVDPDASSTLRMPPLTRPDAETYAASGYLPLAHSLRQGGATFSWYHGPLAPGEVSDAGGDPLPARAADELLRYDTKNGLIDVSYAAAWELGRLLALKSKGFSTSLFKWKRSHRQTFRRIEEAMLHAHPHQRDAEPSLLPDMPENVRAWFDNLRQLKGVPFPHLVPDERMLPKESIRFFRVDPHWVEALQDGAFSIGRVLDGDHEHDGDHPAHDAGGDVSGFLLRSEVVSGWPGLLVDGYGILPTDVATADPEADPRRQSLPERERCEIVRMDRLSKNVLICLFDGVIKTVDIHLKPETLHFGLEPSERPGAFQKELRDAEGEETDLIVDADVSADRVVKISALAGAIKSKIDTGATFAAFTSAQLALELTEGVERVRFIRRAV